MSTRDFLARNPTGEFTDEALREALTGNYCRRTGYNHILQAAKVAAGRAAPLAQMESDVDPRGGYIGQPIARREDRRLVMGGGATSIITPPSLISTSPWCAPPGPTPASWTSTPAARAVRRAYCG